MNLYTHSSSFSLSPITLSRSLSLFRSISNWIIGITVHFGSFECTQLPVYTKWEKWMNRNKRETRSLTFYLQNVVHFFFSFSALLLPLALPLLLLLLCTKKPSTRYGAAYSCMRRGRNVKNATHSHMSGWMCRPSLHSHQQRETFSACFFLSLLMSFSTQRAQNDSACIHRSWCSCVTIAMLSLLQNFWNSKHIWFCVCVLVASTVFWETVRGRRDGQTEQNRERKIEKCAAQMWKSKSETRRAATEPKNIFTNHFFESTVSSIVLRNST